MREPPKPYPLQIPPELKRELERLVERRGVPLNSWIVQALQARLERAAALS